MHRSRQIIFTCIHLKTISKQWIYKVYINKIHKKWRHHWWIHPWNLTWNLKMRFLLETIIFRFHVKFRGSSLSSISSLNSITLLFLFWSEPWRDLPVPWRPCTGTHALCQKGRCWCTEGWGGKIKCYSLEIWQFAPEKKAETQKERIVFPSIIFQGGSC